MGNLDAGSIEFAVVNSYVRALRTAEFSATEDLEAHLAEDVTVARGSLRVEGKPSVLRRLRMAQPMATALTSVGMSSPELLGDGSVRIVGEFPPLGAAPERIELVFTFDREHRLEGVVETIHTPERVQAGPAESLPPYVRGCIDGALANATPICFAYADEAGRPRLSLRGSVHVIGDLELGMWLRPTDHSASALARHPDVSLLYRDHKTRTTLTVRARARVVAEESFRDRVYRQIPEVEQSHDPARQGKAVLIEVDEVSGTSPRGPVLVRRSETRP